MHVQRSMPASHVSNIHWVSGRLTNLEEVRVLPTNEEDIADIEAVSLQADVVQAGETSENLGLSACVCHALMCAYVCC